MKYLTALAASLMALSNAHSATITCSAEILYPTQVVSGTCTAGRCVGTLPSTTVTASGSCSDGESFDASAISGEGSLVGRCNGDEFVAIGSALVLDFNGGCSSSGTFKGRGHVRPQWISGSCSENGTFSAAITRWDVAVHGSCVTPTID